VFLLFGILFCIALIIVFIKKFFDGVIRPLLFYYPNGKKAIYSDTAADNGKKHIAIIAINYPGWIIYRARKNTFIYSSGIEILKKGLEEIKKPYIIYHPSTPQEFREIITTKEANPIWIIGHGFQYGVSFKEGKLHFEEFVNLKKDFNKDYIVQLQCWGSKTLIDDLCENSSKSYYTDRLRDFDENRDFIIKTIEKIKTGNF